MEWLLLAAGGALGIPASMVATYLYGRIVSMRDRNRLAIEGVWGEFIEGSDGHQFTLGQIYFDRKRKIFAFDGTNFENSGAPYCHFSTLTSSVDFDARKFLYTFEAQLPDTPNELYFGFGVVNLALRGRALHPTDGHYVSASVDGKPMSHTMVSLSDLKYRRGEGGTELIDRMAQTIPPPRKTPRRSRRTAKTGAGGRPSSPRQR